MTIGAPDTQAVFRLMTEAQFPHGLRCGRCNRVILPGQPFTDDPTGVHSGGAVIVELICVYCDREQCWCLMCDEAGHTNWPPEHGVRSRLNACPDCGRNGCVRSTSHNLTCDDA